MALYRFEIVSEEGVEEFPLDKDFRYDLNGKVLRLHYHEKAFPDEALRDLTFVFSNKREAKKETLKMLQEMWK